MILSRRSVPSGSEETTQQSTSMGLMGLHWQTADYPMLIDVHITYLTMNQGVGDSFNVGLVFQVSP